jgi:hypothetical protein
MSTEFRNYCPHNTEFRYNIWEIPGNHTEDRWARAVGHNESGVVVATHRDDHDCLAAAGTDGVDLGAMARQMSR